MPVLSAKPKCLLHLAVLISLVFGSAPICLQAAGLTRVWQTDNGLLNNNNIWFVAGTHLFTCGTDGSPQEVGAFETSSTAPADALLEDHTRRVWVGTDGTGLFRYDKLHVHSRTEATVKYLGRE